MDTDMNIDQLTFIRHIQRKVPSRQRFVGCLARWGGGSRRRMTSKPLITRRLKLGYALLWRRQLI